MWGAYSSRPQSFSKINNLLFPDWLLFVNPNFISKEIDGRFEAKGDTMNSFLWNNLSDFILEENDYTSCFLEIADWLENTSKTDISLKFFEKVAKSMHGWIKFLDSKF